ncbi:MAG: hypothetical protein ACE5GE_04715 [Phycisphaerae bacterium]
MMTRKWYALGQCVVLGLGLAILDGCATGGGSGGGGQTDNGNGGQDGDTQQAESLEVNFDAGGGSFAVAQDEAGNQYSFKENNGKLIEANVQLAGDGTSVKLSMDSQGRPVKIRASNNENADLTFESGDTSRVRYTSADSQIEDVAGLAITSAKSRVQARRQAFEEKFGTRLQGNDRIATLRDGLATLEEIIESLLSDPDSPLVGTRLADAAMLIGRIASSVDFEEVDREMLSDVALDEVPELISTLAGNTYILFEAQGHCVEEAGLANRLTFDEFGVLLTEFDVNFVFPDFSVGGANPGVTINYAAGTPIELSPGDDAGFRATVAPVFTGTQLDETDHITIERRFEAQIEYQVELFTASSALTEQVFNAALVNGTLEGDILEFDLILVDLSQDEPIAEPIRARYYRERPDGPPVDRQFPCDRQTGADGKGGIDCPGNVESYRAFDIAFETRDRGEFQYDWFVSGGYGYVEDPFSPHPTVVPTHPGFMEVTLVLSAQTDLEEVFEVYTCEVLVGDLASTDSAIQCPDGPVALGEPFFLTLETGDIGPRQDRPTDTLTDVEPVDDVGDFRDPQVDDNFFDFEDLDVEWFVKGTGNVDVFTPFLRDTEIIFYEPGRFEVWAVRYSEFGEDYFVCDVEVVNRGGQDLCAEFGYYGDGICDTDCPEPDPDCALDFDWCAEQGWYGDGFCDEDCPEPDPDCEDMYDFCAEAGLYGDGFCDHDCPRPDPDCQRDGVVDECADLGYYGDGICDDFCLEPDPDCDDFCALHGFYGDGVCQLDCPLPDPDCMDVGTDGFGTNGIAPDAPGADGVGPNGI